jgi:hypothetical protein
METMARNPSYFTSNSQPVPVGIGPGRSSIGAGSMRQTNRSASCAVELDPMAELPLGTFRTERNEGPIPV